MFSSTPSQLAPKNFDSAVLTDSPHLWQTLGTVQALSIRDFCASEPCKVPEVRAISNVGLEGDRHANPVSPRQLLLAEASAYRELDLPPSTLRENLLIDFPTEALMSGDLLRVGADVVLWLTFQCEPCSLLERRKAGVVKAIGNRRGMLARIVRGGSIQVGDVIASVRSTIPMMSNDWKERVLQVVQSVPAGKVIQYRQLAELAGVATAYCRAFPRVLSKLPVEVARRAQAGRHFSQEEQWSGAELFNVREHLEKAGILEN